MNIFYSFPVGKIEQLSTHINVPVPFDPNTTIAQSKVYTTTPEAIQAFVRRTALKEIQRLIREHHFTLEEIEGKESPK